MSNRVCLWATAMLRPSCTRMEGWQVSATEVLDEI
jgi:hypothetical protein